MIEKWSMVDGFEGAYCVSNLGRVMSLARFVYDHSGRARSIPERIMRCGQNNKGYLVVSLRIAGEKQIKRYVHRLVASAFLIKMDDTFEVNHKDGNKLNNVFQNLEWCSHQDNMTHAWVNGFLPPPPLPPLKNRMC